MNQGNLYIVATPIGNLKDITFRAVEILKEVNLIVCEDTRQTKKLLDHYQIKKPLLSFHQHSSDQKISDLMNRIKGGASIAYVSDAGTPNVSDPGGKLVEAAFKEGIKAIPIPGPSALTALVSVSGFKMDEFCFLGFIPHKKGRQKTYLKIKESKTPIVFYESSHRIKKTLKDLSELVPDREMIVGRELTKMFETLYRGEVTYLNSIFEKEDKVKGELAVIIDAA
ncbi:MAG: 16S rRNA (cytidine(1402)-2'-O)-methyltransferase [Patescibacteria group bacterium]